MSTEKGHQTPTRHSTQNELKNANKQDLKSKYLQKAKSARPSKKFSQKYSTAKVAFAIDATGSMGPLIENARSSVYRILEEAQSRSSIPVSVQFFVFRDYDVLSDLVEISPQDSNPKKLDEWLNTIIPKGGGANEGEAIEAALLKIREAGEFLLVLLAGDEPANARHTVTANRGPNVGTAEDEAVMLGEQGIPIHTFVVGNREDTSKCFGRLSELSGGACGRLDGSDAMTDMAVMCILNAVEGTSAVKSYAETLTLGSSADKFAQLLLDSPKGR